jgi:DNA polymerase-3 subunit chi
MTPRIDFYVLETGEDRPFLVYACRVIEKAFLQGLTACVHTSSADEAANFDALLWTFQDRAFVPHELITSDTAVAGAPPLTPVWIGAQQAVAADLLVNLAAEIPSFYTQYSRVAEFVDAAPSRREAGRKRFTTYRDHGHLPETHKVTI